MKQLYTSKKMSMFIFSLFIAITVNSQIRIVNVNPVTEAVTIKNYGSASNPMDISSFWLCNWPAYSQLSGMSVLNGSLNLAVGASVTVTSSVALATGDGELGLYTSSAFGSSAAMEDYMQWGSAGHFREGVAVNAGIWTAGTFVNVTPPYEYVGNGTQNGALFWDTSLSLESLTLDNSFTISPNPSSSFINIRFAQIIDNAQIELFNVLGNRMNTITMNNTATVRLNIEEWSNGVYFIQIKTSAGSQTKRFVKQ